MAVGPVAAAEEVFEYRLEFVNGQVLEGVSDQKDAILTDAGGAFADAPSGMMVHLSCSDEFPGGWGEKQGPDEVTDSAWQISAYTINKYKDGVLDKTCSADINTDIPAHGTVYQYRFEFENGQVAEGTSPDNVAFVPDAGGTTPTTRSAWTFTSRALMSSRAVGARSLTGLAVEMEAASIEALLPGRNIFLVRSSHQVRYKEDGTATLDGDGKKWLKDAVGKHPATVWAEARFRQTVGDDRFHAWPESLPEAATAADMASQPAFADLALEEAHTLSSGLGSVIAVLDTGVDTTHPLLAARLVDGYDLVDDDAAAVDEADGVDGDDDGFVDEAFGHGTFIAGIVAQLAPDATIVPIRVLDADGRAELYAVIEAIDIAIEMDVDVINMSFGILGRGKSKALDQALKRAHKAGIVVVAAAGNSGESGKYFPAAAKDVIAVTALGEGGELLAPFSNHGKWVHVAAPGVDIVSAVPGGGYARWSGTSMATPVVSSLGGLLSDYAPDKDGKSVSKAILDSARKMDHKERADKGIIDVLGSFDKIG